MPRKQHLLIGFLIASVALLASCATGGHHARNAKRYIREHNLNRLTRFDVPIEMNDRVVAWMEYFQGPGRGHFTRYLERSGRYIPLMQEILVKEGMPRDLIYIALIESGFNTQARSRARAVGPWQFIQGTGRRYGLQIDGWVDERRDPYMSTSAAMAYLKDLYDEFGDWYLAMAAYNAGEGRIRRAISVTGSRNFWDLANHRRALRPETRDYVPKYIAAAIMAKMPERFGFEDVNYQEPFSFDTVTAETQTDISVIAKCADANEDEIFDLNPHLIGGATPPNERDYEVRVPRGSAKQFRTKYAALPKEERIQVVRYNVRRGDTLARIAKKYGVSVRALASSNGLNTRTKKLRAGTTIVIPYGGGAKYAKNNFVGEETSTGGKKARAARRGGALKKPAVKTAAAKPVMPAVEKIHKVKIGETIGTIARRYGVSTRELLSLNNLKNPKKLRAGDTIVIRRAKEIASAAPPAPPATETARDGRSPTDTPIKLDAIKPGETESASPPLVSSGDITAQAPISYLVKNGDTLWDIARRHKVSISQIQEWNNMSDPSAVKTGTLITIQQ